MLQHHPTPLPSLKPARVEGTISKGSLQVQELRLAFSCMMPVHLPAYLPKSPAIYDTFAYSYDCQTQLIIKTTKKWERDGDFVKIPFRTSPHPHLLNRGHNPTGTGQRWDLNLHQSGSKTQHLFGCWAWALREWLRFPIMLIFNPVGFFFFFQSYSGILQPSLSCCFCLRGNSYISKVTA